MLCALSKQKFIFYSLLVIFQRKANILIGTEDSLKGFIHINGLEANAEDVVIENARQKKKIGKTRINLTCCKLLKWPLQRSVIENTVLQTITRFL